MIAPMKHLKDRLKWAMERKSMSIPDLLRASDADVTYQGIKKMLEKVPTDGKVEKMDAHNCLYLARALEVMPEWLLTGEGPIHPKQEEPPPVAIDLFTALRYLSESLMRVDDLDRGMVVGLLSHLATKPGDVETVATKLSKIVGEMPPANDKQAVPRWKQFENSDKAMATPVAGMMPYQYGTRPDNDLSESEGSSSKKGAP